MKRKVLAHEAGELDEQRASRALVPRNTDVAQALVAQRVDATKARITAKRLLVEARAVGYAGSARNFRRLDHRAVRAVNKPGEPVLHVVPELIVGHQLRGLRSECRSAFHCAIEAR